MAEILDKKIIERKGIDFDEEGKLTFDECPLEDLALKYGTPCYVFS